MSAAKTTLWTSVLFTLLVACQRPQPSPVWDPPPEPTPSPTPTPKPIPTPVPAGVASWEAFAPVLLTFVNGGAVSIGDLDAALGARRGDRVDPISKTRVVEYWVRSAAGTEKLNVFSHFPNSVTAKATLLNVR